MKRCLILILAMTMAVVAQEPPPNFSALEKDVLWLRAGGGPQDFAEQLLAAKPAASSLGTILDLRFADDIATNAAAFFQQSKTPLIILVNSRTRGEAAALTEKLRAVEPVLVIGSTQSAGNISPDIVLTVNLEDEKKFQENPYALAFKNSAASSSPTNHLIGFVDHTTEADLVRQRLKDGEEAADVATPRAGPPAPVIADPALARAVDLLKALAILHKSRG